MDLMYYYKFEVYDENSGEFLGEAYNDEDRAYFNTLYKDRVLEYRLTRKDDKS